MHNNSIVERKRNLKFDYLSFVGYCFSNGKCNQPTLPRISIITTGILKNKHCDKKDTQNTYAFNQKTEKAYELPAEQCIPCIQKKRHKNLNLFSAILSFSTYNYNIYAI